MIQKSLIAIVIIFLISSTHYLMSQVPNDVCETAAEISNVTTDAPFVCVQSTNLGALPEDEDESCQIGTNPTVWFRVITDDFASLMNIQVQSVEFDVPTISLFHALPDCSNLMFVLVTQNSIPCVVGSNGQAEALATNVGANQIYYIAVNSLFSQGGQFEICVNTISEASPCVVSRNIVITSRSGNGPLTGPFFSGETVGVCMNVNSFTPSGNGCQWFQGLVPVFGNGWDPSSFDANGQPDNATINGQAMGVAGNGIYGAATFDWISDVGYHHDNPQLQIGDFDDNGTIELCNTLYDADCPDLGGITGGCCGPCWDNPGQVLPPGWFAYGIMGNCEFPGPPIAYDWGDGNSCAFLMGPWSFCFELNVRDHPDCLEDETTRDLSLGFFTFADGETGAFEGNSSVCRLDIPAKITLPFCCAEFVEEDDVFDPVCNEGIFNLVLDQPDVDYWVWTVFQGSVTGASEGAGGPGTIVHDTLSNTGSDIETVYYTFLGYNNGDCFVFQYNVSLDVLPDIDVNLITPMICAEIPNPYIISSEVEGGSGSYDYIWSPGGNVTPFITITNPVDGSMYSLTVYDESACSGTATVTISLEPTFVVGITTPDPEQCDGEIFTLNASVTGGENPYEYTWILPNDSIVVNTNTIQSNLDGQFILLVNDNDDCIGTDTITLLFLPSPNIQIETPSGSFEFCANDTTLLTVMVNDGASPYSFSWNTPLGNDTIQAVTASVSGIYQVTVTDANGCDEVDSVQLTFHGAPGVLISTDMDTNSCNVDSAILMAVVSGGESPFTIIWDTPGGPDSAQTIIGYIAGLYIVTVEDSNGCTGIDSFTLSFSNSPEVSIDIVNGDTSFCIGDTAILNTVVNGGALPYQFFWNTPAGMDSVQNIEAPTEGLYQVIVVDHNGCSDSTEVFLTVNDFPDVDLGPDSITVESQITLDAGFEFGWVLYNWNTGQVTQTILAAFPGLYHVCVTDINGCIGCDTIYVEIITNTIDLENEGYLKIFPNPTEGIFTVSGEIKQPEILSLIITNAIGEVVYTLTPETVDLKITKEINLKRYPAGMYYVRVSLGASLYVFKLVIE